MDLGKKESGIFRLLVSMNEYSLIQVQIKNVFFNLIAD